MEYENQNEPDGLIRALQVALILGLALIGLAYAGSLWALSRAQATELAHYRAMPEQTVIDCAAAQAVAECAQAYPGAKCETTAEAAR